MDPDTLPPGPYLGSLESLYLEDCEFETGMPARLVAATQLRTLSLQRSNYTIELNAADVAVLCLLPALTSLCLPKMEDLDQAEWDQNVAHLQAVFVAQGRAPLVVSN